MHSDNDVINNPISKLRKHCVISCRLTQVGQTARELLKCHDPGCGVTGGGISGGTGGGGDNGCGNSGNDLDGTANSIYYVIQLIAKHCFYKFPLRL